MKSVSSFVLPMAMPTKPLPLVAMSASFALTRWKISTRNLFKMLVGPKHWLAKLITTAVLAGVVFICVYKMEYRVKAPFTFVADEKRTISAPFEGTVREVDPALPVFSLKTFPQHLNANVGLWVVRAGATSWIGRGTVWKR